MAKAKKSSPVKKVFEKPVKPTPGGQRSIEQIVFNGSGLSVGALRNIVSQLGPELDDCKIQAIVDGGWGYSSINAMKVTGKVSNTREFFEKKMAEYEEKLAIYKKSLLDELQEVAAEEIL
jgi:hypothetical protein